MLAVEAEGLGKRYGDKWGLLDATFAVEGGELAVLAGPNGAGKTTTIRILSTVLRPSKGRARVLGFDVVREYREARRRISYMPQGYRAPVNLTPFECVKWSLVARGWSIREASAQARRWLELLDLWEDRNRTCWVLSGGQRVRVAVAMALAPEAELTFLDEPTTGLDVEAKHVVWKAVREMVSGGATILLTTHDMHEAEMLADKVVFINEGRTIACEPPRKLVERLPYGYRVVVKKTEKALRLGAASVDVGDRVILYARTHREAVRLVEELGPDSVVLGVDRVGLEDAFLYLRRGGRVEAA